MAVDSNDFTADWIEKVVPSRRTRAFGLGLLVAFLFGSSYILIKIGLESVAAIPFAGLGYSVAVVFLFAYMLWRHDLTSIRALSSAEWTFLVIYGFLWYALTPSTQYLSLVHLPAVTVSILLSFGPVLVAILGVFTLDEHLTWKQWLGIGVYLVGVLVYLLPADFGHGDLLGFALGTVCVFAIAGSTVVGRYVNRDGEIPSTTVTVTSMLIGAVPLMGVGTARHGAMSFSHEGLVLGVAWRCSTRPQRLRSGITRCGRSPPPKPASFSVRSRSRSPYSNGCSWV